MQMITDLVYKTPGYIFELIQIAAVHAGGQILQLLLD